MSDLRPGGGADGPCPQALAGGGWRAGVFISRAPGEGGARLAGILRDELAAAGIDGRPAVKAPGSGPSARDGARQTIDGSDCLVGKCSHGCK